MAKNSQTQGWNNQSDTKRTKQKLRKIKSWVICFLFVINLFFYKINMIDKSLIKLTKRHWSSIQINKIRNEKGKKTTETRKFKKTKQNKTKHQILLQKPILNKTEKSRWNRWFSRQIPPTKVRLRSGKLSNQSHNS